MNEDLKLQIHKLVDKIDNEEALNAFEEDAAFYASLASNEDSLTESDMRELDEALIEVEKGKTISFDDFKKHSAEWIKKLS